MNWHPMRELDVDLGNIRVEVWCRRHGKGFYLLELERLPPPYRAWKTLDRAALDTRDDALRLAAACVAFRLGYPV